MPMHVTFLLFLKIPFYIRPHRISTQSYHLFLKKEMPSIQEVVMLLAPRLQGQDDKTVPVQDAKTAFPVWQTWCVRISLRHRAKHKIRIGTKCRIPLPQFPRGFWCCCQHRQVTEKPEKTQQFCGETEIFSGLPNALINQSTLFTVFSWI